MTFGDEDAQAQAGQLGGATETGPVSAFEAAYPAPGETTRWEGRPTPWRMARHAGLGFAIQLPQLVAAAALVWLILSTIERPNPDALVIAVLFIVAILWATILPAVVWFKARQMRYVVTDRRLVAVTPDQPGGAWQLPIDRIGRIECRDHNDGTATLTLFAASPSHDELTLFGIDGPDAAMAALQAGGSNGARLGLWPTRGGWRTDPASALLPALEQGERLLWMARPAVMASMREIALETAPLVVLSLPLSALIWLILPFQHLFDNDDLRAQLVGIFFFTAWLAATGPMLFFSFIHPVIRFWRAVSTVIAVTDRRVLIAQGWNQIGVRSLHSDDLESVTTVHTREDGRASLLLHVRQQSALIGCDAEFHGVADAATGEAAITALLADTV